ncbi:MAG: hypothetical protein LCH30_09210 [Proteobacteria bacterium]|nr:hypothetical protein [Pseudomonadota bacterium]
MKKMSFCMVAFLLASCSQYSTTGDKLYMQSRNGPDVNVPRPLTDSNISHFYDLPQQNKNPAISIEPPKD